MRVKIGEGNMYQCSICGKHIKVRNDYLAKRALEKHEKTCREQKERGYVNAYLPPVQGVSHVASNTDKFWRYVPQDSPEAICGKEGHDIFISEVLWGDRQRWRRRYFCKRCHQSGLGRYGQSASQIEVAYRKILGTYLMKYQGIIASWVAHFSDPNHPEKDFVNGVKEKNLPQKIRHMTHNPVMRISYYTSGDRVEKVYHGEEMYAAVEKICQKRGATIIIISAGGELNASRVRSPCALLDAWGMGTEQIIDNIDFHCGAPGGWITGKTKVPRVMGTRRGRWEEVLPMIEHPLRHRVDITLPSCLGKQTILSYLKWEGGLLYIMNTPLGLTMPQDIIGIFFSEIREIKPDIDLSRVRTPNRR
jgi:hypothetical protein